MNANQNYTEKLETDILTIRSELLNTSIVTSFVIVYPLALFSCYRFATNGIKVLFIYHICALFLLLILTVRREQLKYYTRAASLLALWVLMGVFCLLSWGLFSMGIPWLIALSVWAGIVMGWRSGLFVSIFSAALIGIIGMCSVTGLISFGIDFNELSIAASPWINSVLSFGVITVSLIVCAWHLNSSIIRLSGQACKQSIELGELSHELENINIELKTSNKRLKKSEKEKQAILNGISNIRILYIDADMNVIWANGTVEDTFSNPCGDGKCKQGVRDMAAPGIDCIALRAMEIGEYCDGEVSRTDGTVYYVQCNPVLNSTGDVTGTVIAEMDVTQWRNNENELKRIHEHLENLVDERTEELETANLALEDALLQSNKLAGEAIVRSEILENEIEKRTQTETALKESEERYRSIIEQIEEGYFEMDMDGNFRFVNNALCKILGYKIQEVKAKKGTDFIAPESLDGVLSNYKDVLRNGRNISEYCYEVIRKDGVCINVESSISLVTEIDGSITGFRGILRDVDKRKKFEEELIFLAYHDVLTGLNNRKAFYERLEDALNQAQRNQSQVALVFIDIDKFKEVNDSLGHDAGDELLKTISERLLNELRNTDYVFRLGGDEFVVMIPRAESVNLEILAGKIIDILSEPYALKTDTVDYVSASLGVSVYPDDAMDMNKLIHKADEAMYKAKQTRNSFVFYKGDYPVPLDGTQLWCDSPEKILCIQ